LIGVIHDCASCFVHFRYSSLFWVVLRSSLVVLRSSFSTRRSSLFVRFSSFVDRRDSWLCFVFRTLSLFFSVLGSSSFSIDLLLLLSVSFCFLILVSSFFLFFVWLCYDGMSRGCNSVQARRARCMVSSNPASPVGSRAVYHRRTKDEDEATAVDIGVDLTRNRKVQVAVVVRGATPAAPISISQTIHHHRIVEQRPERGRAEALPGL
jgi:hypothetical protein